MKVPKTQQYLLLIFSIFVTLLQGTAWAERNHVTLPGSMTPAPVSVQTSSQPPPTSTTSYDDPTLPAPPLPPGAYKILLNFLLTIHKTYMASLGGPIFRAIQWSFDRLGISNRNHCAIVTAALPTIQGWRADLIRDSLRRLEESQALGTAQIIENLSLRPPFDENPRLGQAVGTVVGADGVLECVLVSILDTKRLFLYAAFFGLNFLGFALLWMQLKAKLAAAYQLGASFMIPPILFAANLFVFYLFYQKEIDPVLKILRQFYPY